MFGSYRATHDPRIASDSETLPFTQCEVAQTGSIERSFCISPSASCHDTNTRGRAHKGRREEDDNSREDRGPTVGGRPPPRRDTGDRRSRRRRSKPTAETRAFPPRLEDQPSDASYEHFPGQRGHPPVAVSRSVLRSRPVCSMDMRQSTIGQRRTSGRRRQADSGRVVPPAR